MTVYIIGQGKWGKRLAQENVAAGKTVVRWDRKVAEQFYPHVGAAGEIIVAVPGPYLVETLSKFSANPDILVTSATKGLDALGRMPSNAIRLLWGSKNIRTLGGACISSQSDLDIQYGGEDLEIAGILKNVYAIGFSYLKAKRSDNFAAVWFVKIWNELRSVVGKEEYLSDLVVTCMSPASRNNQAGLFLARGEPILFRDGDVAEGVHTAHMIEEHDLFGKMPLLREITKTIVNQDGGCSSVG